MRGRLRESPTARATPLACAAALSAALVLFSPSLAWSAQSQPYVFSNQQAQALRFAGLLSLAFAALFGLVAQTLLLNAAASIADVPERSFGRAFCAAVLSLVVALAVNTVAFYVLRALGARSPAAIIYGSALCVVPFGAFAVKIPYRTSYLLSLVLFTVTAFLALVIGFATSYCLMKVLAALQK